jgi:hypothetical protein
MQAYIPLPPIVEHLDVSITIVNLIFFSLEAVLKNSRSRLPLERGISRLDFNKLMCSSKQGVSRRKSAAYVSM